MWKRIILTFLDAKRIEERFSRFFFSKKECQVAEPNYYGREGGIKSPFFLLSQKNSMGLFRQGGGMKYFPVF